LASKGSIGIKWNEWEQLGLLGMHQVGFIGHRMELREHQGELSGHQVEMESYSWCSI